MKLKVNKKNLIIGSAIVFGVTGVGLGLQSAPETTATDKTPIVIQVEDHEERIGTLESDVEGVQNEVAQNSADVAAIQQETGISPAQPVQNNQPEQEHTPTPSPSTEPQQQPEQSPEPTQPPEEQEQPEPEPINPRTITAVSVEDRSHNMHTCDYTLYDITHDRKQGRVNQPNTIPCYEVGDILPY